MQEQEVKSYQRKTQKDYSLAFKLEIVDAVEKGELTYKQAQLRYGIQGRSTVLVWLRKHGRLDWKESETMKRDTPSKKIRELEKKLKRLEQEKEILNRAIDIADSQLHTDIRKKYLSLLSEATEQAQSKNGEPLDQ
ncbi:transposase [Mucilaginibacter robiniae]|uniref:Transposase n=1 Tax=Mucilaginibacter robiniae TaxID=2728022 RepID=A0A7L5E2Z1_9SPHI|nr:transposase [Mucilaginibacter robiniae]QJD95058.1 transposase [Mucilaginibacter robiniae]QJD97750.1 transposase [Mucilaginibacter robiniae]QJD97901.1 transposase [Mucilaginibacter robiniae]